MMMIVSNIGQDGRMHATVAITAIDGNESYTVEELEHSTFLEAQ
jgi:hypothetical protein